MWGHPDGWTHYLKLHPEGALMRRNKMYKHKNPIVAIKEFIDGLLYWESDGY